MASTTRLMKFHLFNCDNTYKLDSVENLLRNMESKYDFKILVEKRYFRLQQISEMCEPPYLSCKWISPFSSFMHTNLGSQSTRTTLELVTRNSTEHCCRPQVRLRKTINNKMWNKCQCLLSKVVFMKNGKRCSCILAGVSHIERNIWHD